MLLKDICTNNVVTCDSKTTASEAAILMRQKHVGDVVVVDTPQDGGVPLGIVTDRDLAVEVLGQGLDPTKIRVGSLMHSPVVIANEAEDSSQAIERMRSNGVRRLPVVAGEGEVVGIVTLDDLLRVLIADAGSLLEIMRKGQRNEQHRQREKAR